MTKEYYKEVALVTSYILREDLLFGTFFNTFDEAYKAAEEFLETYPIDYVWGVKEEWDETVESFIEERYINGKRI